MLYILATLWFIALTMYIHVLDRVDLASVQDKHNKDNHQIHDWNSHVHL